MTEFDWRRQLRDLRTDSPPPAHVWAGIQARIGAPVSVAPAHARARGLWRRSDRPALAIAAAMVVAFAIALLAPMPRSPTHDFADATPAPAAPIAGTREVQGDDKTLSEELARNPVLAATDAELRELQEQLQRALAQEPESARLRRMLLRTESERRRLLQYQSQLG